MSTEAPWSDIEPAADVGLIPRPEYPRPQFVRTDWLNLNGIWEFQFDDDNAGLEQRWFSAGAEFAQQILVPFSFETRKSGIGDPSFHPCVWYRRPLKMPDNCAGKRILLHFGAVDYRATVWVNGIVVATHEGGHTPFHCDISGALRDKWNVIVVRAEDPPTDRYIPRGKQHWEEQPVSIFYARTTGIWQTVWMEPVPASYLESARITPRIDGSINIETKIVNPANAQFVTVTVQEEGRTLASGMSIADGPRASVSVSLQDPKLWSPETPHLYDVRLELHDPGGTIDSVGSYFGVRSIAKQDGKVVLNGSPIFLKTVLDQGYWPESNLTPPSDEAIQFDIRATKDLGFNGVRKHQKVEDPRYLYWADKLGLLVSGEMANAYLFNEDAVVRMTREWIEAVNRDYNHPSIVIWVPVNESWGVPNMLDPRQQAHLKALYFLTKSLDDTRLVIDNDGWEHTEVTDLFALHDYARDGDEFYSRFAENAVPRPLAGKLYLAPGQHYNGSPIFLSEFGGVGYIMPEDRAKVPENSWGYSGVERTPEAALARIRSLYQAIAKISRITGICYTQLYDVEQEVNGLLTYDRRFKFEPAEILNINSILR
ncbi:MAG TPA: glycoside hydrolase family 2 TIM barrel-domain containing protein [Bryobacteraceae bacterium]|nr:glycoside hydrolase family 2 TIM barrel-domain containing protein [Bryobacteraceae bacterium]